MRSSFTTSLSPGTFNVVLGATLIEGLLATVAETILFSRIIPDGLIATILTIVAYFALSFLGYHIATNSSDPLVAFIGFNVEVAATSLLFSITTFVASIAIHAIGITLAVTILMTIAGGIFPQVLQRMGRAFFVALACLIAVELVLLLFTHSYPNTLSFIGALIFSGLLAYDWANAQSFGYRTHNSAITACCNLYMDIINIFVNVYNILIDQD